MAPADKLQFRDELTACLTLTVPAGMSAEARRDWLAVAWATVGHLPDDLLAVGCKAAREKADHPAKIVPAIIAATKADYDRRQRVERDYQFQDDVKQIGVDYVKPDEAASILAEYGLKPKLDSESA